MAPLYDLSVNEEAVALLTQKVTGAPARLSGEQQTAEMLLKLRAPIYTKTEDVQRIVLAIVHQMNFQVAQGVDPLFVQTATSTHSKQTNVFRDRYVSPVAADIVAEVALQYAATGGFSGSFTSHRTRSGTG